jgi:hypothetical protein
MKRYRFAGREATGATLRRPDGGPEEIVFHPGHVYDLADSSYVATLVALGHLVGVDEPAPAQAPLAPEAAGLPAWKGGDV